jgi:peroxiredoxin Q/BCP
MLQAGDPAPEFELADQHGDTVSLADYAGQTVVLYFYPKAKTGGCTREARGFRDALDEFEARDIAVLGVSTDPVDLLEEFAAEEDLDFPLLADVDGAVAEAYGSRRDSGKAERNTFVIGADGTVEAAYGSVSPDGHPEQVLADLDAASA